MAREMILVPKLKYEHLLKKLENTEESIKQDITNTSNEQIPKDTSHDTAMEPMNDTPQTGSGYISRRKIIGKPPGVSMKRRKKQIPWLTF
jgi:hypothetical protein